MAVFFASIMDNFIPIIIGIVAILAVLVYRSLQQFKNANIPEASDKFGRILRLVTGKLILSESIYEVYKQVKPAGEKFIGAFLPSPVFVPLDPELIKNIMQKDFNHFVNRGIYNNVEVDPLSGHLFLMEDNPWRNMRAKLTPTFTSGKMKMMFNTVLQTNNQMKLLLDNVREGEAFEIKDVMLRLNSDIIGSCAFGLDISSLKDPEIQFRKESNKLFKFNKLTNLTLIIGNAWPNLGRKLGISTINKEASAFYLDLITRTIAYREKENIYRKDFLHLLIQLKNKGFITDDESLHATTEEEKKNAAQGLTVNQVAAQAFVFFAAGFETSSSVISFTLYELSLHKDIQEKLRKEINKVLEKHNGEINYEAIMEMHYMEMVINEAIRKYPTLPFLNRITTIDYKIPETDIVLKKGTKIFIPTKGLHHDEEYYPDPEKFDPERFSEENRSQRHPFTFLPFGEGPRACIGLRFGMLQTKVALAVLLRNFAFSLDSKTDVPLQVSPEYPFLSVPKGGIWVNLKHLRK